MSRDPPLSGEGSGALTVGDKKKVGFECVICDRRCYFGETVESSTRSVLAVGSLCSRFGAGEVNQEASSAHEKA